MIALIVTAVLLALVMHTAAHLNRARNQAADFRLGERSTLIGTALILAAYGLWAVLVADPIPPALAFLALVLLDGAAWVGAKTAWWVLDRRDAAQASARRTLPALWRQIGGRR